MQELGLNQQLLSFERCLTEVSLYYVTYQCIKNRQKRCKSFIALPTELFHLHENWIRTNDT